MRTTVKLVLMYALVASVKSSTEPPVSNNCSAEYMDSLLQQALQVKEQCALTGRYDCCKAQALAKLAQLHTPQTGVYEITDPCVLSLDAEPHLMKARCDMDSDGGGWTVILRRRSDEPITDFNRGWNDYEKGFGDPNHEFWIGLKNIHCLTLRDNVDLMIDLRNSDGNGMTWIYNYFKVAGSNDYYRITVGEGIGPSDGYDAMKHVNRSQFSTKDRDRDRSSLNCALTNGYRNHPFDWGGGWWHSNCYYVGLTAPRGRLYWYKGSGSASNSAYYNHYAYVEMKIRSQSCNKECY